MLILPKYKKYCFYMKCMLLFKIQLYGKIEHDFFNTIGCKLEQREDFKMKKRLLSLCVALLLMITALPFCVYAADGVEINDTNFPDMNFREYVRQYDIDSNGMLSAEEITVVTSIDIGGSSYSYKNLRGIEYFTALKNLNCFNHRFMTNLDLSKNIALESLNLNTNTSLASLDISGCIALKDLNCGGTRLTTLDVSECPALERLRCG